MPRGSLPVTEQNRRQVQVDLVNQSALKDLPSDAVAAAMPFMIAGRSGLVTAFWRAGERGSRYPTETICAVRPG
jgi:hypothetical protein